MLFQTHGNQRFSLISIDCGQGPLIQRTNIHILGVEESAGVTSSLELQKRCSLPCAVLLFKGVWRSLLLLEFQRSARRYWDHSGLSLF